jgi:crotonobetainyl-CoA:carnitine CoA-transferase CaiB-like acyl-CoA transferase
MQGSLHGPRHAGTGARPARASGENGEPNEQVLRGVLIVDASSGLSGSVATQLLAEMGANVVKVEPPRGERFRATPAFATWNRSKRSVVLDVSTDEGRTGLARLLSVADVFVHSFRPSRAAAYELDDRSLLERYPTLVVCAVTGYPGRHAQAERPGYDILVQASVGLMDEQVGYREGPVFLRCPVPSWGATHLAAAGIVARLFARGLGGHGGTAHTSLWQGALGGGLNMHWSDADEPTPSMAKGMPKDLPTSLVECADGVWVHVMPQPKKAEAAPMVAEAIQALSAEALEEARRREPPNAIFGDVAALRLAMRTRPSREWLEALWEAGVAAQPVRRLGEVLRDDWARANGYVVTVEDPVWGAVDQAGPPVHLDPPATVRGPAPNLGETTVDDLIGGRRHPIAPAEREATRRYPLEGVRVLDFGQAFAGPYVPMLLADLGADVIKVELSSGEFMRSLERQFVAGNRGKRSISLDLKHPKAKPVVEALVRWADVVHLNIRPLAATRLGIDEASLRAVNPTIVYSTVSAYGPGEERAAWPGADQLFLALCGWEDACAGAGNPPLWLRVGFMDYQAALASLVGTLGALLQRQHNGQGQRVQASLLGSGIVTTSETLARPDGTIIPTWPLPGADQTGISAGYRIYRVSDGWVAVAAVDDEQLAALRGVAGAEADKDLEGALGDSASGPLLAALEAAGVAAEPVRLDQRLAFLREPEHEQAGFVAVYPHPTYKTLRQIGALWDFGDLQVKLDRAPPELGQHTEEVLAELGFSEEEIADLRTIGAAVAHDDIQRAERL